MREGIGSHRHLVIVHLYGRRQAEWGDFVELRGHYRAVADRCGRVDVIVPRGALPPGPSPDTLHIREVAGGPESPWLFAICALRELQTIHRESAIEILWVQDPLVCGAIGWLASRRNRFPWVAEICNDFFDLELLGGSIGESWLKAAVATWTAMRATRVRAVSSAIRDHLVSRGVPAGKVAVLSCPTDMAHFDPDLWPDAREGNRRRWGIAAEPVVMFVGALVHRKGVDLLIDAAAMLRGEFPALRVALIGDGPMRGGLESRVGALGLDGTVMFLGRMSQDKVPGALAAADLVVLPSRNEGLPRCLVEALAMQRPVVATRISGNTELVEHGETGVLVEPTSEALGAGLARLLRLPPSARDAMGRLGRERVVSRFGLAQSVDRMIDELLEQPIEQAQRASGC
jgi:glycosyltransferase involved in cell wall biosynthesis